VLEMLKNGLFDEIQKGVFVLINIWA
jgi:hypothetical protein